MNFRSTFSLKVLVFVSLITTVLAVGSATSVYLVARDQQMNQIHLTLLNTAKTIAALIDVKDFETAHKTLDTNSVAWHSIKRTLFQFQQHDRSIHYVYTMAPTSDTYSSGKVMFVVDPTVAEDLNKNGTLEEGELPAKPGEIYDAKENAPNLIQGFKVGISDSVFTTDKWGTFISGYAPILDSNGRSLGLVGVDMTFAQIDSLKQAFLIQVGLVIFAVILTSFLVSWILSKYISKPISQLCEGMEKVAGGDLRTHLEVTSQDEFGRLAKHFNQMTRGLQERKKMLGTLERYMSKELADIVLKNEGALTRPSRKVITVLFCDIQGMTAFAEQNTPQKLMQVLSTFQEHMAECVFNNGGIVDKMMGDGLMAIFGAPLDLTDHASAAIQCAIDMQKAMRLVRTVEDIDLEMGVGIHSGEGIVGNIGSRRFMDYTVIGDVVNVASRIEHLSRNYPSHILSTSSTLASTVKAYQHNEIGPVDIRGRKEPVLVHEIIF